MNQINLSGRNTVIIGGARGIGYAHKSAPFVVIREGLCIGTWTSL